MAYTAHLQQIFVNYMVQMSFGKGIHHPYWTTPSTLLTYLHVIFIAVNKYYHKVHKK